MLSSAWPQLVATGAGRVFFANASKVSVTTPNGAAIVAGTLLVPCAGNTDVTAFDVVGTTVFWATRNDVVASTAITSLRVGPLGAFVTTLRGLEHITLGSSRLVVPGPIDAFALDGTHVYWTSESRGIVARTSLFDGTTITLASRIRPTGIAVDAQSAFIVDVSQGLTSIVEITPK